MMVWVYVCSKLTWSNYKVIQMSPSPTLADPLLWYSSAKRNIITSSSFLILCSSCGCYHSSYYYFYELTIMWKSLSRLTCLSGKKMAAPLRMAFTASLCKAFSTNVSPSGPSTTKAQTWEMLCLRNQSWELLLSDELLTGSYCGRGECRLPSQP